jgi:hypothetical protein
MHHAVERSIALWKAQNGPFRKTIGNTAERAASAFADAMRNRSPLYIDYTERRCDYT